MEQVPNTFPSLFIGYTVFWALLALYLLSLGVRLARVEKRIKSMHNGRGSEQDR